MEIDLKGRLAWISGARHTIAEAVAAALVANGVRLEESDGVAAPEHVDILILSHDLKPPVRVQSAALVQEAAAAAAVMADRGSGRILHVMSAMGVIPMRRQPGLSAQAAAIIASVRALAMTAAPHVLVNAVAAGALDGPEPLAAGDPAMLSHVPLGRPGRAEDVANAVLFLLDPANSYTTGQVIAVDGGWTAGYGRDF
jgi:NAD(P)-dependent dehydrogenase (short-subunit alcohol dehydrogenase family)